LNTMTALNWGLSCHVPGAYVTSRIVGLLTVSLQTLSVAECLGETAVGRVPTWGPRMFSGYGPAQGCPGHQSCHMASHHRASILHKAYLSRYMVGHLLESYGFPNWPGGRGQGGSLSCFFHQLSLRGALGWMGTPVDCTVCTACCSRLSRSFLDAAPGRGKFNTSNEEK
jgi:hypothetical protein